MKLSLFPENRVTLINAALASFFVGNSLPVISITGPRATRLKKWFGDCTNPKKTGLVYAIPLNAGDHCIRIRWIDWRYDAPTKLQAHKNIQAMQNLDALGSYRLPADIAKEVARIKNISIHVYHHWNYKSFFFSTKI